MPLSMLSRRQSVASAVHFRNGVLEPLAQSNAERTISKDILTCNQVTTVSYLLFCFSASIPASFETNCAHSTPIPPFVPKTRGVNDPCSTSRILCIYSRFLAFSCERKVWAVFRFLLESEFTCVTRMSKNAVCPLLQKPLALMSSLASSWTFADLRVKCSFSRDMSDDSTSTSTHTLSISDVNRSRRLSCLWR